MKDVCTVPEFFKGLMDKPDIETGGWCAVCGSPWHVERHHIVKRSQGRWVEDGREHRKPTVMLCGFGNVGGCHGEAHAGRLHFRFLGDDGTVNPIGDVPGRWQMHRFPKGTDYLSALGYEHGWYCV